MALPLLVVAVVLALRVMPAKGTSLLVLLDVGLAWFSALSAMVLVPTDVSTTLEVSPFTYIVDRLSAAVLKLRTAFPAIARCSAVVVHSND